MMARLSHPKFVHDQSHLAVRPPAWTYGSRGAGNTILPPVAVATFSDAALEVAGG